jgi:hypothetical protein
MIIGLSMMSITISNSKQIHKTEYDIQSTDLAEMGFVYNYTAINDTYMSLTSALKTDITSIINKDLTDGVKPADPDHYTKLAITELFNRLTDKLRTNNSLKPLEVVALQGNHQYKIVQNIDYISADYDQIDMINNITFLLDKDAFTITILYNSAGSSGDTSQQATKSLKLNFDIKINSISVTYPDGSTGPIGGTNPNPTGPPPNQPADISFEVTMPSVTRLQPCSTTDTYFSAPGCSTIGNQSFTKNANIYDSIFHIGGDAYFKKIDTVSNSTVYITGDSYFDDKIDSISSSKVHIDGSTTIKGIDTISNNSILEVGGNLSVLNPIQNVSGSTIRTRGDLSTQNIHDLTNQSEIHVGGNFHTHVLGNITSSTIKVNGNATIHNINNFANSTLLVGKELIVSQPMDGFNNSIIKVYGDASFNHINNSSNSSICVFGTLKQIGSYPSSVKVYTKAGTSDVLFKEKCGTLEDKKIIESIEFDWEPSTDVEYQYDYDYN